MLEIDITALPEGWVTNRVEYKIILTRIGNSLRDVSRDAYHVTRQNIGWCQVIVFYPPLSGNDYIAFRDAIQLVPCRGDAGFNPGTCN